MSRHRSLKLKAGPNVTFPGADITAIKADLHLFTCLWMMGNSACAVGISVQFSSASATLRVFRFHLIGKSSRPFDRERAWAEIPRSSYSARSSAYSPKLHGLPDFNHAQLRARAGFAPATRVRSPAILFRPCTLTLNLIARATSFAYAPAPSNLPRLVLS